MSPDDIPAIDEQLTYTMEISVPLQQGIDDHSKSVMDKTIKEHIDKSASALKAKLKKKDKIEAKVEVD